MLRRRCRASRGGAEMEVDDETFVSTIEKRLGKVRYKSAGWKTYRCWGISGRVVDGKIVGDGGAICDGEEGEEVGPVFFGDRLVDGRHVRVLRRWVSCSGEVEDAAGESERVARMKKRAWMEEKNEGRVK